MTVCAMGKRSKQLNHQRRPLDFYPTPRAAVLPMGPRTRRSRSHSG
jgi:hypothetical protein